jgi:hypothetical protein
MAVGLERQKHHNSAFWVTKFVNFFKFAINKFSMLRWHAICYAIGQDDNNTNKGE